MQEYLKKKREEEQKVIRDKMKLIKHKILILSGKGGVGKSTVAVNLAVALANKGKKVGLLDVDIHGPSIPVILNLRGQKLASDGELIIPIKLNENLKVVSIGFLLNEDDDALIWRGPMKNQVIKQFLKDVDWGELDYLIIDSPPGTGDEPLSVIQMIEDADGAVIVTTPQKVAISDVRKGIKFCEKLELPVIGVIENMSGFVCTHCGKTTDIFNSGGAEVMAEDMKIPFLGKIPIDPEIVESCDSGKPYIEHFKNSQSAKAIENALSVILNSKQER